ncbi:MAG: hypothetical protein HY360_05870, partial [Verrucomicrobia bacterium]|nr:hypothetical protein [Verrucomicrobiota bacterium]
MKTKIRSAAFFFLLLLLSAPAPAADADATDPAKLDKILGSAADWTITPAQYEVAGEADAAALTSPGGVNLSGKASQPAPCECLVSFRLKPAKGAAAHINVQLACAERTDKTEQSLGFNVGFQAGQKFLNYTASVQGGTPPAPTIAIQSFEAVSDVSLAWSEEMRRSIEAQIAAAPKIEESLLTLRCTVEKERFRCWLNGRFVSELPLAADMDPRGVLKIQLDAKAELVSLKVRPLKADGRRFEPLSISGNLNSGTLNGIKLDHVSLPHDEVDGVPFQFPTLTPGGMDHIDVGQSWTRFGALMGYFRASDGAFGGRWTAANRLYPARIAMYIPPGRYKALHLVAVADGRKDSVPVVSAQFYRPDSGHPINFAGKVPSLRDDNGKNPPVPIKLADGKSAKLYHVVIPLDPDDFSWFTDLPKIGLEITKQVQFYRAYPDPLEYSWHGAGLPSSAQIYAMTLERAGVDVDIQPDQFGHIWTAPAAPSYTIEFRNTTGSATKAKLVIETKSYDGKDTTSQNQEVALPADGSPVKAAIALKPTRYGLQEMTLTCSAAGETAVYRRNFAFLHPDTREHTPWESGHGSIFGFWRWGGGHTTPPSDKEIPVMAAAGAETTTMNFATPGTAPELQALARKYHFTSELAFAAGVIYYNDFPAGNDLKLDLAKPEETGKALVEA